MKKALLWIMVNMCRMAVSAIFIFSGLVKLIDPHGTEYKIQDYLHALNLASVFDIWYFPLAMAVFMGLMEFCLGVYLLIGMRRRTTLSFILLLLFVYTPLTLWLAMTDAVVDCGCFGDAIKLTNWQTFMKNVILLALSLLLWFQRRRMTRFFPASAQWLPSLIAVCSGLFLAIYCLYTEPVIDFRPFYVGQHIPSAMEWPDDPNGRPEILDFDVQPLDFGGAATASVPDAEELLADSSLVFLLTMPHLEVADDANMEKINAIYDFARRKNYRFLALTPANETDVLRWRDLTGAEYDFAFMDELTLKTIARSNPALVVLHAGTIVGKWSHHRLPSENQLRALSLKK